jgi:fatty acyl-CoA reductase
LAEQLLEEKCGNIPLAIVRPSIVTGALSEPVPGWVDNMNGTTGKTIPSLAALINCIH